MTQLLTMTTTHKFLPQDGEATAELCPDGLLFDDKIINHEKCVHRQNVDCGARIYVQGRKLSSCSCQVKGLGQKANPIR